MLGLPGPCCGQSPAVLPRRTGPLPAGAESPHGSGQGGSAGGEPRVSFVWALNPLVLQDKGGKISPPAFPPAKELREEVSELFPMSHHLQP